ncbi:uncharacterized protein CANTADRAFT_24563 [Suhomyces tanzawaensis NRRL Y-17324]|uniref:Uncharacterized protein n=1 Tax=Suhomyces tanzawaensis NRRL Y-17324 TaxID=984487 RepID=A0A1E4SQE7_9ASCO|nr:uncharacterized protein CANTADRAFT_24563 [Suhomyces tanzawaensis NRRL Y-17324]ODV81734.1 hypothetical protein CANTADRAFT_24563 [Suhomyces tanzawaensis NRRL Y-17324]
MSVPSSPIGPSSEPLFHAPNVLDDMHRKQQERSSKHTLPWSSSPIRRDEPTIHSASLSSPRSRSYHHHSSPSRNGHTSAGNMRNKHNKVRQFRNQHRQEKLEGRRHILHDAQVYSEFSQSQLRQFEEVELHLDLDQLIEEERQAEAEYEEEQEDYEAYIRQYENDLEDFELQEELEMAELISRMDIGDKS